MATIRPAAVAGMFYPRDARTLAAEVEDLLGDVQELEPRLGFPKALIVPHAGYIYSGPVAARAYDELTPARGVVERVVLLGPVHRVPVRGLAIPTASAFATPLGEVPLDIEALRAAREMPQVVESDAAHALEHSLEVQLPFLQRVLGDFKLLPFAVGAASVEQVEQVIERFCGGPESLLVISTDMSHYHTYEEARRVDASTLARIESCATDIRHEEACGATPLNGMLAFARKRNMRIRRLAACNSGDTAGGKDRVVGYSSFALYDGSGAVSKDEVGGALLDIARRSIDGHLFPGGVAASLEAPWLRQAGATFVTLKKSGQLRGCIGSLRAARALGDDVAHNAVAAAFRDPRFPALCADEWPHCQVEVSMLSAPKPLHFADEDDLVAQVRAGVDGLIVEAQGHRGTFLPQVWESIPDVRAFLRELVRKAGLPADTRLARCKIYRYRVLKFDGH